jgi:hypothetical protein
MAVERRKHLLDVTLSLKAVQKPFTITNIFLPLYSCCCAGHSIIISSLMIRTNRILW